MRKNSPTSELPEAGGSGSAADARGEIIARQTMRLRRGRQFPQTVGSNLKTSIGKLGCIRDDIRSDGSLEVLSPLRSVSIRSQIHSLMSIRI